MFCFLETCHSPVDTIQWRSPEEYFDYDLDEQVDVFALGNNMYSLLTGLWPFYDEDKTKVAQARVKSGVKPFIDPRYLKEKSLAEAKLAEIIDRCYAHKPEDRPSIFEVVEFLRDALKQFREQQTSDKDSTDQEVQQKMLLSDDNEDNTDLINQQLLQI